jgi:hypothetical protein
MLTDADDMKALMEMSREDSLSIGGAGGKTVGNSDGGALQVLATYADVC